MAKLSGKITASFEPSEGGKLLYLPVAIMKPPYALIESGMINFSLKLSYKAAPSDPKSLKATKLKVRFPRPGLADMTYPIPDKLGDLKDGGTLDIFLDDFTPLGNSFDGTRGSLWIPTAPAPAAIRIEMTFKGFEPVTLKEWPLQAHANPTPEGSYAFPFKTDGLADNQYYFSAAHHFPDHAQHWAYDFEGYIWDGSDFVTHTGPKNIDYPVFARRIYASADGIVLKADDRWPDHTKSPLRKIMRTAIQRGPAGVISVTAADPDRIFTGITDEHGKLRLLSFAPGKEALSPSFLGKSTAGEEFKGDALSTTALSTTQVVVAGVAGETAFVSLYSITTDGVTIDLKNTVTLIKTVSIGIARCSATQFLMVRQPKTGNMEISLWDVGTTQLPQKPSIAVRIDGLSSNLFDLAVIDDNRAVIALKRVNGKLKIIVWNLGFDDKTEKVTKLERGQDAGVDDKVKQISVSGTKSDGRILVGAQNSAGKLAVYYFQIDADTGVVELLNREVAGPISSLALVRFKRAQTAAAVIDGNGNAKLIGYEIREDTDTGVWEIQRTADYTDTGGAVKAIDIARIIPYDGEDNIETCAVAVRTASDKLKLILWRQPKTNNISVLYGNECVRYAHLKQGSIPPGVEVGEVVKKGVTVLGRAGFSGSATMPHLHIQCEKVDIDARSLTPAQRTAIVNGTYVISGSPRPMLFHGVSALATSKLVHKGWKNEPFVNVEDKGFYFQSVAIYPKRKP